MREALARHSLADGAAGGASASVVASDPAEGAAVQVLSTPIHVMCYQPSADVNHVQYTVRVCQGRQYKGD